MNSNKSFPKIQGDLENPPQKKNEFLNEFIKRNDLLSMLAYIISEYDVFIFNKVSPIRLNKLLTRTVPVINKFYL